MATKIDVSALTITTEEASEIGAAILEGEFTNGELANLHEIMTGVEHKKQIPFVGKIADSLKLAAGCVPGEAGTLAFTEKTWDPIKLTTRFTHCADDLNNLLKIFSKAKKVNPDFYDRIGSEELGLVASRVGTMLRETLPIKIWFSDTAAEVHGSGGVLTTGVDKTLYNPFNGLWKQIFAAIPSGDYFVDIAKNAEASYAAQALSADIAFDTLESMYEAADERLREDPDAKFYLTRSLADNYRQTIRTDTKGAGFVERMENGTPVLYFEGIKIEIMYVWDRFIKANQDNGTKWNIPHRALLTTPANIPVGTLASEDFEELDSFYDKKSKSNIMDVAFSLDAKFLEDYMAVAAY